MKKLNVLVCNRIRKLEGVIVPVGPLASTASAAIPGRKGADNTSFRGDFPDRGQFEKSSLCAARKPFVSLGVRGDEGTQ